MKNTLLLLCLVSLQSKAQTFLLYNRSVVKAYGYHVNKVEDNLETRPFLDTTYMYSGVIQLHSKKNEYLYYAYIPKKYEERRIQKANYSTIGNKVELLGKLLKGSIYSDSILDYKKLPPDAQDFVLFPIGSSASNSKFDCCWSISSSIFDADVIFDQAAKTQTVVVTKRSAFSHQDHRVGNGEFEWGNRIEFGVNLILIGEEIFFQKNDSSLYLLNENIGISPNNERSFMTKFNLRKKKQIDTYSEKEIASKFLGSWKVGGTNSDSIEDITQELTFSYEAVISKTYFRETNYNRYDTYKWSVGPTGNSIRITSWKGDDPIILTIKATDKNQIILQSKFDDEIIYTRKE